MPVVLPVDELGDRLVVEDEALVVDRSLEVALQRVAAHDRGVELRLEDRVATLAARLGRVHGDVRIADERLGTVLRPPAHADADAAVDARFACREDRRARGALRGCARR